MKHNVFNYIKENPGCTVRQIADALGMDQLEALQIVEELDEHGFLTRRGIPMAIDSDGGVCYMARGDSLAETL